MGIHRNCEDSCGVQCPRANMYVFHNSYLGSVGEVCCPSPEVLARVCGYDVLAHVHMNLTHSNTDTLSDFALVLCLADKVISSRSENLADLPCSVCVCIRDCYVTADDCDLNLTHVASFQNSKTEGTEVPPCEVCSVLRLRREICQKSVNLRACNLFRHTEADIVANHTLADILG